MADENPMGSGRAVAVTIPDQHREFLLATIGGARDGLIFDLEEGLLGNPERGRMEIEAYTRLVALAAGEAVAIDGGMRASLRELALTVDRMNQYERAAREHSALWGMALRVERAARPPGTIGAATSGADGEYSRFLREHHALLGRQVENTTAGRILARGGVWRWLWGGRG